MPEPTVKVLLAVAQSAGGIGRHVKAIATGLPARGVQVVVCAPASTIEALRLTELDCRVVSAPLGGSTPSALRASRRILSAEAAAADIVHAHGLRAGAFGAAFAGDRPLIVSWHNAALGGSMWKLTHAALARYVARHATVVLAASDDLAASARAAGARRVQSTFVAAPTLAAPSRTSAQVRAELSVGDRPLVLAVGRLQHQKRFDVLVEAAAGWGIDDRSPVVVIAGDGPDHDALVAQIESTRAPVRLLGDRGDVADLLAAADVVALPSEWEARALVAQEALIAGVPLVTTAVGGLPSLVGDAAAIVPVGDAGALREAIEAVLADDAVRAQMIALGLKQTLDWPDQTLALDELIAVYLDLKQSMRRD
jgi:glycosyltransferase involved in cell wall biosynthesis